MTEQEMIETFHIGRDIAYHSTKHNKLMKARLVGSWWDRREGLITYGANVCVTFAYDKIRHTHWVNQKHFSQHFPDVEMPNE